MAAGDAAGMLAELKTQPADKTFLTDEVLAYARRLVPVTDVVVTPDEQATDTANIKVTYKAGTEVSETLKLVKETVDDKEVWLIDWKVPSVNLAAGVPFPDLTTLNGVSLAGKDLETVYLFPGAYEMVLDHPLLQYEGTDGKFTVTDSGGPQFDSDNTSLVFSNAGVTALRTAIQGKVDYCINAKELNPSGCGMTGTMPDGTEAATDTIVRQIRGGDIDMSDLELAYRPTSPTSLSGALDIELRTELSDTAGRSGYWAEYKMMLWSANFEDPNNIQVTILSTRTA
jgi:hypothetical protein